MLRQFAILSTDGYSDPLVVSESIEPKSLDFIANNTIFRISQDDWRKLRDSIDSPTFNWDGGI